MLHSPHTARDPVALIDESATLLSHALELYSKPDAYLSLPRFTAQQARIDWGTAWTNQAAASSSTTVHPPTNPFPTILQRLEALSRTVRALQTVLTSFAAHAYTSESERLEIFGMPPGKAAFRNIAEYLRDALKIPLKDAKSRLKIATSLIAPPRFGTQQERAAPLPRLAEKFLSSALSDAAAEIIVDALSAVEKDAVRNNTWTPALGERIHAGEQYFVEQAVILDPDGLRQLTRRWAQYTRHWLDQDGRPPNESLDRKRGAFYRGEVQGLHNWVLRVDSLFHERLRVLSAVINNPGVNFEPLKELLEKLFGTALPSFTAPVARAAPSDETQQTLFSEDELGATVSDGDIRTREQRLLDGMTAIVDTGLSFASSTFPVSGGVPAQLSVLMDYQTLYQGLTHECEARSRAGATTFISQALFTGPISPSTIRPLSCEANLIPAVLGSNGAVLDLGRSARLFSLDQRRALIARDRGCAAPGCKIPAPWCDAHHVQPWHTGGTTDLDNAVLLCSHHHHAVHAGIWSITMRHGIAWFTPAPYLDPDRRPRRNRYWR